MSRTNYIDNAKSQFTELALTDSYRSKRFTKNFSSHLNTLIETSENLHGDNTSIYRDKDIVITDRIYWQTEAVILEKLDDIDDDGLLNQLDNLEDLLYDRIKSSLGKNYDKTTELNKIIDNTVHSALLSVKYNYFSKKDEYANPWDDARKILTEDSVLYSFSSDMRELFSMGYSPTTKESEDVKFKKIGVIGRGNRREYTFGYIRDLIGLRNTVLDFLGQKANSRSNPINTQTIVEELRKMGIAAKELSDSHISSLLIGPLKRNNKIGSCNEGYFLMNDCADVEVSYNSHLETLKGFYNTLENHRQLALRFGCLDPKFDEHRKLFSPDSEEPLKSS